MDFLYRWVWLSYLSHSHNLEEWVESHGSNSSHFTFFNLPLPSANSFVVFLQRNSLYSVTIQVLRFRKALLFIFPFHLQSNIVRYNYPFNTQRKKLRDEILTQGHTTEKWSSQDSTHGYLIYPWLYVTGFLSLYPFDKHNYYMSFDTLWNKYSILSHNKVRRQDAVLSSS